MTAVQDDIAARGMFGEIRDRVVSSFVTTRAVWIRRRMLLSPASPLREPGAQGSEPTPPLKYFLLMLGLSGGIETALFPPVPPFEMPPGFDVFDRLFAILPELTVFTSLASVVASALIPWIAYRIAGRAIPLHVVMRAYAYQIGGLILPAAIIANIVLALLGRAGWQPWMDYADLVVLPLTLWSARWVGLQLKDEGYSRVPLRVGATIAVLLLGIMTAAGLKASRSFRMPSTAMMPTIARGDVLMSNQWVVRWRTPARGEIVVIDQGEAPPVIGRVIGLPGDEVSVQSGALRLNGTYVPAQTVAGEMPAGLCGEEQICEGIRRVRETLPSGRSYDTIDRGAGSPLDDTAPYHLGADEYFVLGDDRDNAADSRIPIEAGGFGLIPRGRITGIIYARRLPIGRGDLTELE